MLVTIQSEKSDHAPLKHVLRSDIQSKNAIYANIKHNIDTSIKLPISGHSTSMVKGCMDIMFDMVDTVFSYY